MTAEPDSGAGTETDADAKASGTDANAPPATDARIVAVQLTPEFGAVERNRNRTVELVREHADADLIVFPELVTSGYVFESKTEVASMAEPRDGETARAWSDVAADTDTWIVGGVPEADGDAYYNSALVVSPSGVEAVYRKVHRWNEEHRWFDPGTDLAVVDTPFGRLGVQICNDLWFPELTIAQARAGVDIIAVPTNWVPGTPDDAPTRPGGWTVGVHQALAHANSNRVFVACADRAGTERGVTFEGQSVILDPEGVPLAGPAATTGEYELGAECALERARAKKLTDYDDVLASRRPAIYGTAQRDEQGTDANTE
ncbi:nitrilase-related carbon-nitrogen hydrolase [Natrialba asiatica]|uniref:Nitrilase/cyanide hydratase and apolipoprotein N-acyltransferase n=1 Tax=Natrialba asiatica (strain ATCC 700177 / DSM 12278 / JCM 9576 / FERM P-10747 / NBRC 102637 / 172P1) TaxID=29540 RepID=M0AHD7_NATA1|nr:nitrilase-related carbon-nitrogen hydrolase [Natrialba asiatica]ELY98090.1 nitrilase/cyanide hydratase and apolipoprotein N-acyltransferase [Natrialba asiatica DSM 12278]